MGVSRIVLQRGIQTGSDWGMNQLGDFQDKEEALINSSPRCKRNSPLLFDNSGTQRDNVLAPCFHLQFYFKLFPKMQSIAAKPSSRRTSIWPQLFAPEVVSSGILLLFLCFAALSDT